MLYQCRWCLKAGCRSLYRQPEVGCPASMVNRFRPRFCHSNVIMLRLRRAVFKSYPERISRPARSYASSNNSDSCRYNYCHGLGLPILRRFLGNLLRLLGNLLALFSSFTLLLRSSGVLRRRQSLDSLLRKIPLPCGLFPLRRWLTGLCPPFPAWSKPSGFFVASSRLVAPAFSLVLLSPPFVPYAHSTAPVCRLYHPL